MEIEISQEISRDTQKEWRKKVNLGRFLLKNNLLFKIVRKLNYITGKILSCHRIAEDLAHFINFKNNTNYNEFGYTEKYGDLAIAMSYSTQIDRPNFGIEEKTESFLLYKSFEKIVSKYIDKSKPSNVLTFGVCYAHIDNRLAQKYPEVTFSGIDQSPYNKSFNDTIFADTKNLEIYSGDVFEHFKNAKGRYDFLIHTRTLVLLPKSFIIDFYKSCFENGVEYIIGAEQTGFSLETMEPYTFDLHNRDSVYWRNNMFIHNYLALLKECGYEILECELVKTSHPHPDFQILQFVAKRKVSI